MLSQTEMKETLFTVDSDPKVVSDFPHSPRDDKTESKTGHISFSKCINAYGGT